MSYWDNMLMEQCCSKCIHGLWGWRRCSPQLNEIHPRVIMRMMVGPVKTVNKDLALQLYYTSLTLYLPPSTVFSFPLRISRCFTCRKSTTCSWSLPHQVLCEFFIMDSVGYRHVHKLWQDVPRTLDLSMTAFAECIFSHANRYFLQKEFLLLIR